MTKKRRMKPKERVKRNVRTLG